MCTQTLWNNVHKHLLWETKAVKNENTTVCCDLHHLMSHTQSCLWFCINFIPHDPRFIIWDCWILRQGYWPETPGSSDVFDLGSYIPCTVLSFIPHNYSLSEPRSLCIPALPTILVTASVFCGDCRVNLDSYDPNTYKPTLCSQTDTKITERTLLIEHTGRAVVNYCFFISRRNHIFHRFQKLTGLYPT